MKRLFIIICLIILIVFAIYKVRWSNLFSHGELSAAHEGLECEECHTKGERLDNDKCLLCHTEINERLERGTGYHARVSMECFHCHSEHHGRSYQLIHLDTESFDHSLTGWPLNDKHALFRCKSCHPKHGYLLDKTRCIDCHRDVHEGQFGEDCKVCHNEKRFKIIKYSHKSQDNDPQGKHAAFHCSECHEIEYKNYMIDDEMVINIKGKGTPCIGCHEDEHKGKYDADCSRCHNQISFKIDVY